MAAAELERLRDYRSDMERWVAEAEGADPSPSLAASPRRCRVVFTSSGDRQISAAAPVLVTELFIEAGHDNELVLDMPDDVPEGTDGTIPAPRHPSSWYLTQLRLLLATAVDVNLVIFVSAHVWSSLKGDRIAGKCRRVIIVADAQQLPALQARGGGRWIEEQTRLGLRIRKPARPSAIAAWAAKVNVVALASRLRSHRSDQRLAFVDAGITDDDAEPGLMSRLGDVLKAVAGDKRDAVASVIANARLGVWASGSWFGGSVHAIQRFDDHVAALVIRLSHAGLCVRDQSPRY